MQQTLYCYIIYIQMLTKTLQHKLFFFQTSSQTFFSNWILNKHFFATIYFLKSTRHPHTSYWYLSLCLLVIISEISQWVSCRWFLIQGHLFNICHWNYKWSNFLQSVMKINICSPIIMNSHTPWMYGKSYWYLSLCLLVLISEISQWVSCPCFCYY